MDIEEQTNLINEQLGITLKTLRETASLSIESVAASLNLKPSIIENIEERLDDIILEYTYPIVFLRGYLLSYAKLVGLKNIENFTEFKIISISKKDEVTFREPLKTRPAKATKRKKSFFIVIIIVAVALGIYLSGMLSDDSTVDMQIPSKLETTSKVNDVIPQIKIKTSLKNEIVKPKQQEPEMMDLQSDEKTLNKQAIEEAKEEHVAKEEHAAKDETDTAEIKDVINKATLAVKRASLKKASMEMLTISFSGDCWTEIYDANNKRIAFGLYKKGRTIYPKGIAPFKIQLGDPGVVTIMRGKKEIPHNYPAGKKAYITLQPLSN